MGPLGLPLPSTGVDVRALRDGVRHGRQPEGSATTATPPCLRPIVTTVDADALEPGLLGPSGSGKTPLMRAIVGVQIVERGQVTVLGQPAGSPALRRRVAYVTQAPSVYADLTVEENLRSFARILGAPRQRIEEVIGLVGLTGQTKQVAPGSGSTSSSSPPSPSPLLLGATTLRRRTA